IYPVKGYSLTLPLAPGTEAPYVSVTDESRRIVCSRLGNRLRAAGTAELTGFDTRVNPARCDAILRRVLRLFPRIELAGQAEYWAGLRPATPGNVPVIGRSRLDNLFYDTGHGTLGWTLACGSGQAIADIMGGKPPRVEFPFTRL
ncbi:MAG: FAD-dependent oxidoreductase, partial [Phycisphaerales bacterium]|nr:FAD-dependent oxidoreductase [Phycisphaerales bacterium]